MRELLDAAAANGVDASPSKIEADADDRLADDELPAYSSVHRNEFRLFYLAGRCHPWVRESTLRECVDEIP